MTRAEAVRATWQAALEQARRGAWSLAAARLAALTGATDPLPQLAAVLLVLGGRRGTAIGRLRAALRRQPDEPRLTHCLFLAAYHGAVAAAPVRPGQAVALLALAIACWTKLRHDSAFWAERAAAISGEPVSGDALRASLGPRVDALLEAGIDAAPQSLRLRALLERERRGAEILTECGGVAFPGMRGRKLVCGPLMLARLRLEPAFARLALRLAREQLVPPETRARLERYFSALGDAQALLDLERPSEALMALADLRCPRCRAAAAPTAEDAWPQLCAPDCSAFARRNPGFAAQPTAREAIARSAHALGIDARLALARTALLATTPDIEAAAASWREALQLARALGCEARIERQIRETGLGRALALQKRQDWAPTVALLEAVEPIVPEDDLVNQELALALGFLAVERAGCGAYMRAFGLLDEADQRLPQHPTLRDCRKQVLKARLDALTAEGRLGEARRLLRREAGRVAAVADPELRLMGQLLGCELAADDEEKR